VPIIQKLVGTYKLWHEYCPHLAKTSRYTLGNKIDSLFIETVEAAHRAMFLPRERKLGMVEAMCAKLDMLKFFLQIAWEIKALDQNKYVVLSEHLQEVGRMAGGWLKNLQKETSAPSGR
jgi:hypothetical protein